VISKVLAPGAARIKIYGGQEEFPRGFLLPSKAKFTDSRDLATGVAVPSLV
jgi:hypothetical protein